MATLSGKEEHITSQMSSNLKEPTWFQNLAKRVIPNHLVPKKRLAFQLSAPSNNKRDSQASKSDRKGLNNSAFNSTDFNLISFGNTARRNSSASHADALSLFMTGDSQDNFQSFDNDDLPLYNDNDDLPPARSLYDLNDEVFILLNKPAKHTESFINKDPKSLANAFHQKSDISAQTEDDSAKHANPMLHSESAILVFGYPETMSSQVIAYFSEFGTILEQFEALKPSKNARANILLSFTAAGAFESSSSTKTDIHRAHEPVSVPIFSGNSWVKITYDNPSSAIDALQESGSVFNGVLIGVVPYTKDAIEKLQRRKLSLLEDIGGGFPLVQQKETHEVEKGVGPDSNDIQASYIKRLDVKDGSGLFLSASANGKDLFNGSKKEDRKLGFLERASKYFFGFHDL